MLTYLRLLLLGLLIGLPVQAASQKKIKAVASFSILADIVKNVGGDNVEVVSIVGPNADAHVYQPTPHAVRAVADADIIFINGLGLEGWIERLIDSAGYKGKTIAVATDVKSSSTLVSKQLDPHAWHSVANVIYYVRVIEEAMVAFDPTSAKVYHTHAARYIKQLQTLDHDIRSEIKALKPKQRRVITAHDAFQYFGRDYGVQFRAPMGVTTEAEPTPQAIAMLIQDIRKSRIRAVFIENLANARIIEQISKDAGVPIEGMLYSDALSESNGPAGTYIDLMRHNVRTLVKAMQKNPA